MKFGIYAGSFDPFHVGHMDILTQSLEVFDKVIVARGQNSSKSSDKVPLPKILNSMEGVEIATVNGLLTDWISELERKSKSCQVFLIRGLRNGYDLNYEQNQLCFYRGFKPNLKVVFFTAKDKSTEFVSSSALREIRKFSEEEYKKYTYE